MTTQLEFLQDDVTATDVATLRQWLSDHGWQTRRQLASGLGWCERKIRVVAELMGDEVVRGQQGFKLSAGITRDDLPAALQAAQAAISQGKRMIRYGLKLNRKLHALIQ